MPVRFLSPSLGGSGGPLKAHGWEVGVAFRHLGADQWFVGTDVRESAAPFGQPLFLNIDSLDVNVSYGVSDRISVTLTVPFSRGTHSRFYADGVRHKVSAAGLGDVSLVGNVWLRNPAKHPNGNVALGVGLKTPSGNNAVVDDFFQANGSAIQSPVDQSIQLGDGGLGIVLQAQAFQKLFNRASAYFYGWYLMTPREQTAVPSPSAGVPLSVPDVYSLRSGVTYALRPKQGISASLGTRIDGIPVRDIVGGSNGFRRPGYSLYLDPGLGIVRGRGTWTVNVPLRVHQNFKRSLVDVEMGASGGGDLANYLIIVGYSRRF
ncbi:conserved exported hypothetical protein [Candidatus Sulfopaludibacter sp. SbA4]|nr:conserved exported hypothetical protein [Candidatus Sulfopaludibacter sp. SbA4]